jgi:hypothetical protein
VQVTAPSHEEVSRIIKCLWVQHGNAAYRDVPRYMHDWNEVWGVGVHDRKPKSQAAVVWRPAT